MLCLWVKAIGFPRKWEGRLTDTAASLRFAAEFISQIRGA
jgi:hypothetical protein